MSKVVIKNVRADPKTARRPGGANKGGQGCEQIGKVIGHIERVVTQRLDLACLLYPFRPGSCVSGIHAESIWLDVYCLHLTFGPRSFAASIWARSGREANGSSPRIQSEPLPSRGCRPVCGAVNKRVVS